MFASKSTKLKLQYYYYYYYYEVLLTLSVAFIGPFFTDCMYLEGTVREAVVVTLKYA